MALALAASLFTQSLTSISLKAESINNVAEVSKNQVYHKEFIVTNHYFSASLIDNSQLVGPRIDAKDLYTYDFCTPMGGGCQ